MGQAVGTTAAISVKDGCDAYDINIEKLQATLTTQGAFLGHSDI